nr:MAG TPA: hypothetical protein [Caudoviricetes sp.]
MDDYSRELHLKHGIKVHTIKGKNDLRCVFAHLKECGFAAVNKYKNFMMRGNNKW